MSRAFFFGFVGLLLVGGGLTPCGAEAFHSQWANTHDRIWAGRDYWANPMEDWRIADGRLECLSRGANRNVALLTYALGATHGSFAMSVRIERLGAANDAGPVGMRIGIRDEIADYRAAALRGTGINCGLLADGKLYIAKTAAELTDRSADLGHAVLRLTGEPAGHDQYTLTVTLSAAPTGKTLGTVTARVPADQVTGLVALTCGPATGGRRRPSAGRAGGGAAARWAFRNWQLTGEKVQAHPDRAFGPILWAMHTLTDSHGPEARVLKITAQMPPIGKNDSHTVAFQVRRDGRWRTVGQQAIDPDARTATFRLPRWDATKNVPYRLVYIAVGKDGAKQEYDWTGTIRREPIDRPLVFAAFTGNEDSVFPNHLIVRNVGIQNPDMLFFSGDQIYENVGGYGIIRTPADRAIVNYLRKWYLFGWAFGDLMRDRPTVCLPDDHDVFQGNLWGEGGQAMQGNDVSSSGGYIEPVKMVNVVHRTQTAHLPDPYDPTPIARGISVYYCPMVYGRVGFAIIADRMFKSGPKGKVNDWPGRADHCLDPHYDTSKLDKPGLVLLGERQLRFLHDWAADWRGTDIKVVLSQTIFCNLANYHGPGKQFIYADLDSNGWPQTGRNKAVDAMRRGFALHVAGDQHLASIVWHGIKQHRDANFSFCVPSIAVGYPRAWRPDREGRPVVNRPPPGLPNTGDYRDAFGHPITVYAVGNPAEKNRPGRINTAHDKASGYGVVRVNKAERTYTLECWHLQFDARHPRPEDQFPGWPKTIAMLDNYGRAAAAYLPTLSITGTTDPVVQVIDQSDDQIEYTLRIRGRTFRPRVFSTTGTFTVRIGQPDTDTWQVLKHLKPTAASVDKPIHVKF